MARLKSRTKFPPGEFQVLHPEAGMKQPFKGSFREAVMFEKQFRQKNRSLAESLGLPADEAACEVYVDEYNAKRCISHGWTNFVEIAEAPAPVSAQKKTLLGRVVGVVGSGKAAISAYQAMFGQQGPAPHALAEQRAAVCATCPQNDTKNGIYSYFVKAAAKEILGLLGALKDINVKVKEPDKLGVCKACLCPMRAKVFAPIDNIKQHAPKDIWDQVNKSDPKCWMLTEAGR